MDNRPFPELRRIVRDINDSRIWVQAEWVRPYRTVLRSSITSCIGTGRNGSSGPVHIAV